MPKKSKKQYSFPILKRKEIIKCMKELSIIINETDLKSPHEEKCKLIYSSILEKLMGINVFNQEISNNQLCIFQYPSLHESSIISVRLFRELIQFMQKIGVSDFSISDLISPHSQRTIRNLSAIINFARWREQKYQIYLEQKLKISELNKNLKTITSENSLLATEFVKLNKKKEIEKPQIDILRKEINKLQENIESAHSEMERKADIARNIKKEVKKLKTMHQEKKTILNKNSDIIYNLDKKIVKSPQRIKKELKLISNKINLTKIEISQKTEKLNYDLNKLNHLKLLKNLIIQRLDEMKQINILKNDEYNNLDQEIKKLQILKQSLDKELKSMIKTEKLLNINLNTKKKEYSALQQEHKRKKQEIQIKNKQIDNLKKKYSKQRIEKQTEISKYEKQIELKKETMINLLNQNKQNINQLNIKYKQILQNVQIYHKNMKQGIDHW